MKHYDPLTPPDPEWWQAMDELEQARLVEEHHRRARVRLPNLKVHALFHVIVENQILLGDEIPVRRTLHRLMSEGLDRHDAIHAIGMVLAGHMNDLMRKADVSGDVNETYYAALESFTAEEWLRSA